jgi:gliding motility-associated-like protein
MKNNYLATANFKVKLTNSYQMIKLLKKSLIPLLFMIPLLFSGIKAEATHMMGADITYRCIDTLKFEITLKWYRDCRGISLNGAGRLNIRCTNGTSRTVTLGLVGIREITPLCASEPSRCSPANTRGTGEGVEEHTYRGIVDFNISPLNALARCTGKIIFGASVNARNGAITTGPRGTLYTDAELNISKAPCNTSPGLTSEPVAVLCCDQPFFFNNGALDTANFDSLSYSWGQPMSGYGQQTNYSGDFAYNNPFTAFYPSPVLKFPFNNPNANPPIGVYLDPLTGDIIVTPTNCSGEVTVAVIEVTEWRANPKTGVMEEIGKTRRDLQFIVKNCPGNKPPTVNGPYTYSICEGNQLCFNITTNDLPFIPPPPAPIPPLDTVLLDWNGGISGATFTILDPTARLKTGRFCWTPPIGAASTLPYTFTATARDDACPLNAVTVRGYRILVKPKALAEIDIDTLACGIYPIKAALPDGFQGKASYNWSLLDSNRNLILDNKSGSFKTTGTFLSVVASDTLVFRRGGKYLIQLNLNNNPLNCPSVFYDTLIVPPLLEADLSIGKDTFVCAGTDIVFDPYIYNYNPPLTYQWITMGVEDDGTFINNVTSNASDNKDTFRLSVPNVQYDTAVGLLITDGSGCTANDTIQVFLKSNPRAVLPPDIRICTYDEFMIVPNLDTAYWIDPDGILLVQGDTLFKEWYYNGNGLAFSKEDSVTVRFEGLYTIQIYDSLGCSDTDTMLLYVNDTVRANAGPDQTVCMNDTFTLSAGGIDTAGANASGLYIWYDITPSNAGIITIGSDADTSFVAKSDRVFRLELYRTQGGTECFDEDTVIIRVDELPVINLGSDEEVCCDYGAINLNLKVNSAAGGSWFSTRTPSLVSSNEYNTDAACGMIINPATSITTYATYRYQDPATTCFNQDSFEIKVKGLPPIISQEKQYCQDYGAFRLASPTEGLIVSNVALGTPSWRCLDSNSTLNRFVDNMLENRGGPGFIDYWLNITESAYTIQNPNADTVVLEFSYRDQFGCRNQDTVSVIISKVPKLKFRDGRELCFDEGEISLNDLFDVTPSLRDGNWSIENTIGFRIPSDLGGLTGDSTTGYTINTLDSKELPNAGTKPNSWRLRYTHRSSGCPTFLDTNLVINPLPTINLTDLNPRYCEDYVGTIGLLATPSGGTWTCTNTPALVGGSEFSPSLATVFGTEIKFYYDYTDNATGCSENDSISSMVDLEPTITLATSAVYCIEENETSRTLNLPISATNNSSLLWIPTDFYGNRDRITAGPINNTTGTGDITLTLQNQRADTFRIGANAGGLGACKDKPAFFEIIMNPLPEITITNSNPAGCDPVTTDLGLVINNDIDPTTASYNWNFGNGSTSTNNSATMTYTGMARGDISLTVTSAANCSTTVVSNVLVYPIPNASFVPDPNNYTTAALPRFVFTNRSGVDDVNGAVIASYAWDFGDPNVLSDTSSVENPSYYYSTDTATYCANLEVTTNHGCIDDTTVCVVVGPDLIVFIPNAFTPNISGPDQNEGFRAIISGEKTMELIIFNRWGEILFQTTEKDNQWDGMYKGVLAQQDVYAYQLKVTTLDDELYTYSGTVTLIR